MSRYFTKSRFKLATECPTKLFFSGKTTHYANLKNDDTFLESLADGGFQVGELAKLLYPGGKEISKRNNEIAVIETEKLLSEHENIVLFEPAIRFGNFFIRIDILRKQGSNFELIEVKAKSYNSQKPNIAGARIEISSVMLPYIQDVAFQTFVLKQAYPQAEISSFLMMPDKAIAVGVDGLNQLFKLRRNGQKTEVIVDSKAIRTLKNVTKLLAKVPVNVYVDVVMRKGIKVPGTHTALSLSDAANQWSNAYANDERIEPVLHKGCANCEFRAPMKSLMKSGFHECLQEAAGLTPEEIDQGTVLDIWNYRDKDALLSRGIYRYSQIIDEDIQVKKEKEGLSRSQRQWMQVKGIPPKYQSDGFYLEKSLINRELSKWSYPLHMIDFETATVALPFFKRMRPYESVAFQFSHHVIEEDGSVRHAGQFLLAEAGVFPNFEFVRALKRGLETDKGTVFCWSAHENTILNHIRHQLDELTVKPDDYEELVSFISQITNDGPRSMIDLAKIAERAYFHPDTKGRVSIKKVLPAVLKTSPYLKKKYQRPVYGAEIPSLNFSKFIWWEKQSGQLIDPYQRLREFTQEILGQPETGAAGLEALDVNIEIAEGGAAAMAFARLQFEDLNLETRARIKAALLRYCELDTLAMVMIVEAWRDWSSN